MLQVVGGLIFINLLLWLVFFIKFKKLFSTDETMKKFQTGMEQLLSDMQRQISVAISLAEEQKKQLKALVAEAERKIAVAEKRLGTLQNEKSILEQTALFQNQIASHTAAATEKPKAKRKTPAKTAAEKYKKHSSIPIDENAAYALTGLFTENAQNSLFEEGGQSVVVNQDGDSYGKIPLVKPEIVVSDNPIVPKKDFSKQVRELSELGRSVEDISAQTGRTTTEVELMLAMLP